MLEGSGELPRVGRKLRETRGRARATARTPRILSRNLPQLLPDIHQERAPPKQLVDLVFPPEVRLVVAAVVGNFLPRVDLRFRPGEETVVCEGWEGTLVWGESVEAERVWLRRGRRTGHQGQLFLLLLPPQRPRRPLRYTVVARLDDELDVGYGFGRGDEGFVCARGEVCQSASSSLLTDEERAGGAKTRKAERTDERQSRLGPRPRLFIRVALDVHLRAHDEVHISTYTFVARSRERRRTRLLIICTRAWPFCSASSRSFSVTPPRAFQ